MFYKQFITWSSHNLNYCKLKVSVNLNGIPLNKIISDFEINGLKIKQIDTKWIHTVN